MESDVSKLQRDRQGHISTGVVYLFILCCYGALGHPELWAQTQLAQPPVEAGRTTDPRQEQLLQAQITVTDLRSRLGKLRERRRELQSEFQPPAWTSGLDLVGEQWFQAELEVAQSEMAAVEAWLKAKEIEVDVLQQIQELYELYESMVGSEERIKLIQQYNDTIRLVAVTEVVEDGLLKLIDTWESAQLSYTRHQEVLDRAIEDSKTRDVNEEVLQRFADKTN